MRKNSPIFFIRLIGIAAAVALFSACSNLVGDTADETEETSTNGTGRSFYMGYTTWPFAIGDTRAQDFIYEKVRSGWYADIAALHFMDGIPWTVNSSGYADPSVSSADYTGHTNADLGNASDLLLGRITATAPQSAIYLAIDPLNDSRNERAKNFATGVKPGDQNFDTMPVHYAYTNYALYALWLIYDHYSSNNYPLPQIYFNFGSEASDLRIESNGGSQAAWNNFEVFAEQFHDALSGYTHSDTTFQTLVRSVKLLFSAVLRSPGSAAMTNLKNAVADSDNSMTGGKITDYTDLIGISTYGYLFYDDQWGGYDAGPSPPPLENDRLYQDDARGNPHNLPSDWLSQIQTIAPGEPYGITETGWIGEDLMRPSMADFDGTGGNDDYLVTATEAYQKDYVEMTLAESDEMNFEFVIFFTLADYDIGHDYLEDFYSPIDQTERDFLNLYDAWIKTGFFQPASNMDTYAEYTSFSGSLADGLEERTSWNTWKEWFDKGKN